MRPEERNNNREDPISLPYFSPKGRFREMVMGLMDIKLRPKGSLLKNYDKKLQYEGIDEGSFF